MPLQVYHVGNSIRKGECPMSDQISSVVVDTSSSPYAHLRPVPISAVKLTDTFWAPRLRTNQQVTIPDQLRYLEETGRIDNFRRAAGKKDIPFQGIYFNDSDVYKWLEAASWILAGERDASALAALSASVDAVIDEIADAQQPLGYLNTYFVLDRAHERWTNLQDLHELYCAGHLIQAAVAHHRVTGSERLLQVARRMADLICKVFGPVEEGKRLGTSGHEEIEMALVELARDTGDHKYLRQAQFFLDVRGRGLVGGRDYHQDHKPFRELDRMVGHAVRAVYLNAGAVDVYAETGDGDVLAALERLWRNMIGRQMYISGGIGSRYEGEAFGKDYELPNARAYAESCAAIGSMMWNWRMLALNGEARFADVIETALYNGILVGLGLDGQSYFYQNPLSDDGSHRRQPWFGCACCPPNIARTLASLPGYFYSVSREGVWAHLYAESEADVVLPDGRPVRVVQHTLYPWDGRVQMSVQGEGTFSLFVRIPSWCEEGATVRVNEAPSPGDLSPGSYLEIRRAWQPGDQVYLDLPMRPRRVACHPYVAENSGRVALMRGPLLYCVEQIDHPGFDLRDILLPADAPLSAAYRPDLLGGVVVLEDEARVAPPGEGWSDRLYGSHPESVSPSEQGLVRLTAIPYYAWANRDPGAMLVWLRTD
jgi:DUF1680 family protein